MKNAFYFSFLILLASCASIDLPPGGDKDTTPPTIVSSSPDSAETFFTGDQIKITFDEYFSLNNFNTSLIVSPPLGTQPKTTIKGKSLLIQLNKPLLPNTTYQFYFDDGIKDLNEGNATKNLRLVFSTGPQIDTSFISGSVVNAFTRQPEEGVKVMLYKEFSDSQLIKDLPFYITKTTKTGSFLFNNISDGQYYLYALKDENNNNTLDITERFAINFMPVASNTTQQKLFLTNTATSQTLNILSHKEITTGQYIVVFNHTIETNKINVTTRNTFIDISKDKSKPWHYGQTRDSIYVYNNSKELNLSDSFEVVFEIENSQIPLTLFKEKENVTTHSSTCDPTFSPIKALNIKTSYPIRKINQLGFKLFDLADSNEVIIDSATFINQDLFVYANWKENHSYSLINDEKSILFFDQQYHPRDTVISKTLSSQKTGELELSIIFDSTINDNSPYFLCLTKNNNIVQSKKILKSEIITFSFLSPGSYEAYIFNDENKNGFWTDSDYIKKTHPEAIWHLNSPIDIRSNWKTNGIVFKIK